MGLRLAFGQSPRDVTTANLRLVKNVVEFQRLAQELQVSYKPTAFRRWVVDSVPVDAYSTNRDVYVSGDNLRSCLEVRDAYNRDASFLSDIEREMSEALIESQAVEAISLLARFALGMDDKDTDTDVITEFASSLRSIAETLENTTRLMDDCLCDESPEDEDEDDYCDDSE